MRYEDRLEGALNYLQRKVKITVVLKENKLWSYVSTVVPVPVHNPIALDLHEVKEARTQRILLDGVKDHLIPHLDEKKTAKEMWDAMTKLYQSDNQKRKMALRDKLHATKIARGEGVTSYLTRLTQFRDELAAVGDCYPRYLGITRRSCLEAHMVLDMEYREQERPEHGPGGPIFFFSASFVLSAVPASITTGLGLHQKGLLLHEVIGPRYHGMCHI
jgi:hypothetical protein